MFKTIGKLAGLVCIFIDALHDIISAGKAQSTLLLETSEADVDIKRLELQDRIAVRRQEYLLKAEARKLDTDLELMAKAA